jgi:ribosome-binding factor A
MKDQEPSIVVEGLPNLIISGKKLVPRQIIPVEVKHPHMNNGTIEMIRYSGDSSRGSVYVDPAILQGIDADSAESIHVITGAIRSIIEAGIRMIKKEPPKM